LLKFIEHIEPFDIAVLKHILCIKYAFLTTIVDMVYILRQKTVCKKQSYLYKAKVADLQWP
jgi:hypothetical protein